MSAEITERIEMFAALTELAEIANARDIAHVGFNVLDYRNHYVSKVLRQIQRKHRGGGSETEAAGEDAPELVELQGKAMLWLRARIDEEVTIQRQQLIQDLGAMKASLE